MTSSVLFYRDFKRLNGGQLKVWDYHNHVVDLGGFSAEVYLTPGSVRDETNPWVQGQVKLVSEWNPGTADILFLDGMDWDALPPAERDRADRPIVNLIQGVQHAEPDNPRFSFLRHRAIRICVSEEVTRALADVPGLNGPLFTIPNGLDHEQFPDELPWEQRDIDVLVLGQKQWSRSRYLHGLLRVLAPDPRLRGRRVQLMREYVPRDEYLDCLRRARVAVFLPYRTEGFYLPALEAMVLGVRVICPDCIGNRGFCLPELNCYRPRYRLLSLLRCVRHALGESPERREQMTEQARVMARRHSLSAERQAFQAILGKIFEHWRNSGSAVRADQDPARGR